MPVINASLKDIQTTIEPFDPGVYVLKIREVKEINKAGRITYQVGLTVTGVVDGSEEAVGKKFAQFISIHKTDGELNPYGLSDLKRLFEAIAPEEADADEPDTDVLIDGEFMAQVIIDEYQKQDSQGRPIGKPNRSNKLDTRSIQQAQ